MKEGDYLHCMKDLYGEFKKGKLAKRFVWTIC